MRTKTIFATGLVLLGLTAMVSAQCAPPMPLGVTEGFESVGQEATGTAACSAVPLVIPPVGFLPLPAGWSHGDLPAPFPPPPAGAAASNFLRADSGGTPSGGTGPSTDVTLGNGAGTYLYLETSGGCGPNIAYLNVPAFDATGLTQPALEFWWNLNGSSVGTLRVEVFDGAAWNTVFSVSGQHFDVWTFAQVPLNTFNTGASQTCLNEIVARIACFGGGTFTSDMAVDEIRFGEATPPSFDTNSSLAGTTIDGVQGVSFFPTIVTKSTVNTPCTLIPAVGTATISTTGNPGATFEGILSPAAVVGLGAPGSLPVSLGGGAIVNLNITQPLTFMNGGATLSSLPFPGSTFPGWTGGTVNIPFAITTAPQTVTVQSLITTPAAGVGFELTQATQLDVTSGSTAAGPSGDEVSVALDVVNAPFCWTTAGMPFYGTPAPVIFIQSNGRLRFDNGTTDFTPTAATASGNAMVGFWADMDTSGGNVSASSPAAGVVRIDYTNVAYFGGPPNNTFAYILDSNTGDITIDGLTGISASNVASDVFLGISPGGGALDPGAVAFVAGSGLVAVPGANIMSYDFGIGALPGSMNGALNTIIFHPNTSVGYDYEGL